MKYSKKIIVDAITFDELVAHGHANGGTVSHHHMPWSFDYAGLHVTHENDDCYIVGLTKFHRGQMLVTGLGRHPLAVDMDTFKATYEPAEAVSHG